MNIQRPIISKLPIAQCVSFIDLKGELIIREPFCSDGNIAEDIQNIVIAMCVQNFD